MTAKNVFDDWMWWCGELHLLQLQDATAATAKWQSLPRAKLDNAINEAQNWFDGNGADGYKAVVAKLERVFGYDRIPGLFAPLGKSPTGTETVEAHELLKAARSAFDALKVGEEALALQGADALSAIADEIPTLLAGRFEVLQRVAGVKPEHVPEITLAISIPCASTIRANRSISASNRPGCLQITWRRRQLKSSKASII
ncbi:hypothetical protein [Pseudomonas aeruginosa]|uniref:hypothetical protein n=1 Tax=Pseudomonas aeruginosa TaxID=287 RepID=UPI001C859730|nr:hypothetical protein [Pseudomonas aeruginosa]